MIGDHLPLPVQNPMPIDADNVIGTHPLLTDGQSRLRRASRGKDHQNSFFLKFFKPFYSAGDKALFFHIKQCIVDIKDGRLYPLLAFRSFLMIERIIRGLPLPYYQLRQFTDAHHQLMDIIAESLSIVSDTFAISIPSSEIAYLAEIFLAVL